MKKNWGFFRKSLKTNKRSFQKLAFGAQWAVRKQTSHLLPFFHLIVLNDQLMKNIRKILSKFEHAYIIQPLKANMQIKFPHKMLIYYILSLIKFLL